MVANVKFENPVSEIKENCAQETITTVPSAAGTSTLNQINHITTNAPMPKNSSFAELSVGRKNLRRWLGQTFRVVITDGRVLIGFFNCTDKDANVVLSMCAEYLEEGKDARLLGNVMIPGKHIVSISVDLPKEEALALKALTNQV